MKDYREILRQAVVCASLKEMTESLRNQDLNLRDVWTLADMIGAKIVCDRVDRGESLDSAVDVLARYVAEAYSDCEPRLAEITAEAFMQESLTEKHLILLADYIFGLNRRSEVVDYLSRFSPSSEELTKLAYRAHLGGFVNGEVATIVDFGKAWGAWYRKFHCGNWAGFAFSGIKGEKCYAH